MDEESCDMRKCARSNDTVVVRTLSESTRTNRLAKKNTPGASQTVFACGMAVYSQTMQLAVALKGVWVGLRSQPKKSLMFWSLQQLKQLEQQPIGAV